MATDRDPTTSDAAQAYRRRAAAQERRQDAGTYGGHASAQADMHRQDEAAPAYNRHIGDDEE